MAPPTTRRKGNVIVSEDNDDISTKTDRFVLSSPFWYLVILSLLVLFWKTLEIIAKGAPFSSYRPDLLPYASLGPLGDFLLFLTSNHLELLKLGFKCTMVVHLTEGVFAYRVSRSSNFSRGTSLKWALQTTLLGFPSFGNLLRITKRKEKKS